MTIARFASALTLGAFLLLSPEAQAQSNNNPDNPECLGESCGRPQEEGGGCGCGGGSVWVNYTDDGDTLAYTDDADGDGRADDRDNCPFVSNRDQTDDDSDAVGNACDNCSMQSNFQQRDADGDGRGDDCDADQDNDTIANAADNCPLVPNRDQSNLDADLGDVAGDVCDLDDDNDGYNDGQDTCPRVSNPSQVLPPDASQCRVDADGDNISDNGDNCPGLANPDQADTDADNQGNACDADIDEDSILNAQDNCPAVPNREQLDDDRDSTGDACDTRYCLVLDPARPDDCLDPKAPFTVSGGGLLQSEEAGVALRPPLFANRNGAAMEYKWTVVKRPEGSNAVVENPQGAVTLSRDWQYTYVDGSVPTFVPDEEGEYELQVTARLAFADRVFPDQRVSTSNVIVRVGKDAGSNCSSVPAGFSATALGAALLSVLMRRRRRQQ